MGTRDNKRPLEPTEIPCIIVAKVTGEISGEPSGSKRHAVNCYCHECISRKSITRMNLNPEELSELIRRRIA